VVGEYDHQSEIALKSQYWQNRWGVHLLTPLRVAGSDQIVLVDRGWIPAEAYESGDWSEFNEPGKVEVQGIIRNSRSKADYGSRTDPLPAAGEPALRAWNFVNIPAIAQQSQLDLLPVYIQQSPELAHTDLPYRDVPELELTEGSHMSYALQWFLFAGILAVGYPIYVYRQESRKNKLQPGAPVPVSHSVV
jgi:surfeit locus 1 family protein